MYSAPGFLLISSFSYVQPGTGARRRLASIPSSHTTKGSHAAGAHNDSSALEARTTHTKEAISIWHPPRLFFSTARHDWRPDLSPTLPAPHPLTNPPHHGQNEYARHRNNHLPRREPNLGTSLDPLTPQPPPRNYFQACHVLVKYAERYPFWPSHFRDAAHLYQYAIRALTARSEHVHQFSLVTKLVNRVAAVRELIPKVIEAGKAYGITCPMTEEAWETFCRELGGFGLWRGRWRQ